MSNQADNNRKRDRKTHPALLKRPGRPLSRATRKRVTRRHNNSAVMSGTQATTSERKGTGLGLVPTYSFTLMQTTKKIGTRRKTTRGTKSKKLG